MLKKNNQKPNFESLFVYVNEEYLVDITIYKENSIRKLKNQYYPNLDDLHNWVGNLIKIIPFNGKEIIINSESNITNSYMNELFQEEYNQIYYGNIVIINLSE